LSFDEDSTTKDALDKRFSAYNDALLVMKSGGPSFAFFAKGGVSRQARLLSSTHHDSSRQLIAPRRKSVTIH